MSRFEIRVQFQNALGLAVLAVALAGCGRADDAPANADTGSSMQAIVDEAAQDASDAGALPEGDAPLKEGQSVQGTIQADVGNGMQAFRSLSTKVADDIEQQVEEKMGGKAGQDAIADANKKLEKLGTGTRVDSDDVRNMMKGMGGKTFHDSQVMHVDIIKSLQVTLKGTAGDGGNLDLGVTFDDKTLAMTGSSLNYRPKANAMFDFYEGKGGEQVTVTIDRFERNADGTYAIAGSFSAKDLPASSMAKKLPSATLASASGTFSFDALPLKEMPKFGKGA
ncbi:hypothetical protein [Thermomonas carbonis]|uniref:Lipoprotein n=1 Tax=Thermomonas carbonis TaxID=1463158 RepID=A0A7G9SQE1_9GAMM|nr:hypothetical protein [Thermomonas carbonis]QNN70066.1 hypothetical protein H9L16_15870 [Thermomonas carbonis]GHB97508.1 hypothetical protein GCM10010080_07060 [Thermomonas carbonis]